MFLFCVSVHDGICERSDCDRASQRVASISCFFAERIVVAEVLRKELEEVAIMTKHYKSDALTRTLTSMVSPPTENILPPESAPWLRWYRYWRCRCRDTVTGKPVFMVYRYTGNPNFGMYFLSCVRDSKLVFEIKDLFLLSTQIQTYFQILQNWIKLANFVFKFAKGKTFQTY